MGPQELKESPPTFVDAFCWLEQCERRFMVAGRSNEFLLCTRCHYRMKNTLNNNDNKTAETKDIKELKMSEYYKKLMGDKK